MANIFICLPKFSKVNLCWIKFFEILVFLALLKLHSWHKIHFNKIFALNFSSCTDVRPLRPLRPLRTEYGRIDTFKLCCWRRLLRFPWMARRSNQSILKEIKPEYSLERVMLKLKLQYYDHLMERADSLEKTLMLGKIENWEEGSERGWDGWMASPTQGHEFEQTLGYTEGQGSLVCCSPKTQTRLSNWTTTNFPLAITTTCNQ